MTGTREERPPLGGPGPEALVLETSGSTFVLVLSGEARDAFARLV